MCCVAALLLLFFFCQPKFAAARPAGRWNTAGGWRSVFKRVAELNSLHFINGLKIVGASGGASMGLIQVRLSRTVPNGLSGP